MVKFMFFDYREVEWIRGFTRQLEQPRKHPDNPLFVADAPWENGNMQLYGSVVKAEGRPFQMWYSVIHRPWNIYLAYAESDDGLVWRRPRFDIFEHDGEKTNIVFTDNPHGPAVIYDAADPREDWRYKMLAGAGPSGLICAFRSADGIHWNPVRRGPAIVTDPDCPIGFLRAPDGRYVAYHRLHGYGRRLFRSESRDFVYWTGEPRMVMEPDAGDPPQLQHYGMGSAPYGPYEVGTLWAYNTDVSDFGAGKMHGYQETELTYARSGYAWHRAAQGTPFIPHGREGEWDEGNLQCASAPVYLEDDIRYYYMGTDMCHQTHWELEPQRAGLGLATLTPDRFVGLYAGDEEAELVTMTRRLPSMKVFVNARIEADGWIRIGLLDAKGKPIEGFTEDECCPLTEDSAASEVRWQNERAVDDPLASSVRLRLRGQNCAVYSICATDPDECPAYHRFAAARP